MIQKEITINNKKITCYIDGAEGFGKIPLLFVGASGLFRGKLPKELLEKYTIYYVDTWENDNNLKNMGKLTTEKQTLTWDYLVDEIEQARKQLGLEKIAIIGHSAAGFLPVEYAIKHPDCCLFIIPYATPTMWGEKLDEESKIFIDKQADENRKQRWSNDMKVYKEYCSKQDHQLPSGLENMFKQSFNANKNICWKNTSEGIGSDPVEFLWKGYSPNVEKVSAFRDQLLNGYDFSKKLPQMLVPSLWLQNLYDFSAPWHLIANMVKEFKKLGNGEAKDQQCNIDYHLFDSGHYTNFEDTKEFSRILNEYAEKFVKQYFQNKSMFWYKNQVELVQKNLIIENITKK